jgi:tetratricopeptide (TPR) repeat protein
VPLKTLRIFLSSPGDVAEERLIARRVIGRLEAQLGDAIHLEPVFWEHEPLEASSSFQDQIVPPSQTDIVVSILWSRLGTLLPGHILRADGSRYASGTEYEFEDALEGFRRSGRPHLLVYRKTAAALWPGDADLAAGHIAQKQALEAFIRRWFESTEDGSLSAAFHPFESPADFEDLLEAHLRRLIERELPANAARATSTTWRHGSPFRGLEPFEAEHSAVFFGRTAAVAAALMKLREQAGRQRRFLLVVGMSGGGKSSLVRAGMLPLMVQPGVLVEDSAWRVATMRPSDAPGAPLLALHRALSQPGALPALAAAELDGTPRVLAARVSAVQAAESCQLALLVDQFEELFSDARTTPDARETFVAALDALARNGSVWVIATLRSDQYPRLAELPALIELKEGGGQLDLLPPTAREIGQLIRLPAAAAGLRFETRPHTAERLDEVIRDAAARNPGALPLLQFLLEELYKRRDGENVLTFRAYEELGGVEGALAQRAEQVLASVSAEAADSLPLILRELVTLAADDDTRALRRVALSEAFIAPASELVRALVSARLLVSGLNEQGKPTVSLAHEALLEFWPRLREWREHNRENLHVRARLAAAARNWEEQQRSADFLLARGKPIAEARLLVADGMRLTDSESALVHASERRVRRFVRLRASAIAGLAVLAVVASVAAYRATVESARARVQTNTAQRTTDFMVSLFSLADPEENRGETVTVREILDKGVVQVREGLAQEPVVRANLMRSMGQAYNGLGLYPRAHELLSEAATEGARNGSERTDLLRTHLALGANRYADSAYAEAEQWYRRALGEARAQHGERHPAVSEALVGIAESIFELDRKDEAERLCREALAIDLALHGERHADTARTLNSLGWILNFQSRYQEAEGAWQRALDIRRAVLGEQHLKVAESWNNLGAVQWQLGDYPAAATSFTKALEIYRKVAGEEHPNTASTLNNLGRVELMRRNLPAAREHLERSLELTRKRVAPDHDNLITPLNSLAMVELEQGAYADAEPLLLEALRIARARSHWMLDQALANCADLYVRMGRLPDAERYLAESGTALHAHYGATLPDSEAWREAVLGSIAGELASAQGRYPDAERNLLAALPVLEKRFGRHGLYAEQAVARLARLYARWGRGADARRYEARLGSKD